MPIPPEPVLRAARRWLALLGDSGLRRTRAVLLEAPEYSDLTPTQYADALAWLISCDVLSADATPRLRGDNTFGLFEATIEHGGSPWLGDSDALIETADDLPSDALLAAQILGLDPELALVAIRHVWGKVDTRERERIGMAGEAALVELLAFWCNARINHVAAQSDGFGYDISVDTTHPIAHLEIKSSTRRNRQTLYLSRNEYETMRRDPFWVLVFVRLSDDLVPLQVFTVDRQWVEQSMPKDISPSGRWESMRLEIRDSAQTVGIQQLAGVISDLASPLLTGELG